MSYTEPNPPHAVSLAYATGIANFLKPDDPSLAESRLGHVQAAPVFVLGLDNLSKGLELENVRSIGWRFLAGARSGNALVAEVLVPGPDGLPILTGVARGTGVARVAHAAQDVKKLPEAEGRELHVLAIPGLLTEAFWLKAIPGKSKTDFVVPFLTSSKTLHVMHAYPVQKFLEILQSLAKKRLDGKDLKERAARKPDKHSAKAYRAVSG